MISARNQLKGVITEIKEGAVNGIVTITFNSNKVSATISMDAIKELGLASGKEATALVKASEVLITTGDASGISARNKWKGTVKEVKEGAVSGIVVVESDGVEISATVSMDAIKELGLVSGKEVTAFAKATTVMILA